MKEMNARDEGWRWDGGQKRGEEDDGAGSRGSVMADMCSVHGHPRWFIYLRPPDQGLGPPCVC